MIPMLSETHRRNDSSKVAQAFIKGKSPITNARQHIGFDVTISLDIVNFFENTKPSHVSKYIASKYLDICFIEDSLPQGFPSSPAISNIAMIEFDRELKSQLVAYLKMNSSEIKKFKLTRYADDITISLSFKDIPQSHLKKNVVNDFDMSDEDEILPGETEFCITSNFNNRSKRDYMSIYVEHCRKIVSLTEYLLEKNHYKANTKKTKIQFSQCGNRIVTGVGVHSHGTCATRASKRRLRAALHQMNIDSVIGLDDWIDNCFTYRF